MKTLLILLLLLSAVSVQAQVNVRGTTVIIDSLTANPRKPSTGTVKYFSKGTHLYQMLSDSSTTRVDSIATVYRTIGFAWYSATAQDSVRVIEMPFAVTIDSIRVIRTGGTSASVNAKKDHGGSFSDLLSSNYTTTTSVATPTGLQNTAFVKNDVLWVVIRAISGTVTELFIQVDYH